MKVLVIGSGGREHALAWKSSQDDAVTKVFVCPGNAGTALEEKLENISLDLNNFEEIADFCKNENIALVIIGPEQPLVMGMTDFLQAKDINTFGPSKAAAQLEGSKTFSKDFFVKYGIPTAGYASFDSFDEALMHLDEIEFRTVKEINSRVLGLMNGDFHGTDGYLPQDQVKRLAADDNMNVMEEESMRIFYSIIHNGRKPFDDVNLRKALSYAFDYDSFIDNILSGSVARNPVPVPNNIWGNPKDEKGYTYDLEKAKEYLAKVKQPIPEITIGALTGYGQTEQAAALLQNGLSKIGVKSKIVSEPWSVASKKMRDEQQMYDLLWLWRSTYYADPNNWIGEMYACDQVGARNNSWYCDPEVDKLLMEARVEPDQAKRAANYKKAAKMVTDDAGGIFVYNTKWFGPYNKKVKGVRFSPIGNAQEMRWVHME